MTTKKLTLSRETIGNLVQANCQGGSYLDPSTYPSHCRPPNGQHWGACQ
jgi:hypothetical protein